MSEKKPNVTQARQILDYQSVIDDLGSYGIYCVDIGLMRIIRKLLVERGMYRTTYTMGPAVDGYFIPSWTEMVPINEAIAEFLGSDDMSCDIVAGLDRIVDAINSMALNCSGGVPGGGTVPVSGFQDDGTNYPAGYASRAEYDSTKCNASQWFVNNWVQDMVYLQNTDYAAMTAAGLGAAMLVPGVDILALIGVILLLVALGIAVSSMTNIRDWINANESIIVCSVYSADNATTAMEGVTSLVNSSNLSQTEKSLALYFVTTNAINKAFEKSNVPSLGADCSSCAGCDVLLGEYSFISAAQFTAPTRYSCNATSEPGQTDPTMNSMSEYSLGCYFKLVDSKITVSNFTVYGTYNNFYAVTSGGQVVQGFIADINNYTFDLWYSRIGFYQSTTQFTMEFEVSETMI